jgi:hypothetical protein
LRRPELPSSANTWRGKKAQGQLQQERTALEEARATLKLRDEEVSRLNGELV